MDLMLTGKLFQSEGALKENACVLVLHVKANHSAKNTVESADISIQLRCVGCGPPKYCLSSLDLL